jgi:membrane fusion protein (multidrug efflux system)
LLNFKFFVRILIIFAATGLVWIFYTLWEKKLSPQDQNTGKAVTVYRAQPEIIQQKAHVIGTIESLSQTTLRARNSGIAQLYSEEGSFVRKGALLAVIQNHDQDKAYLVLKEAQDIAQAQLNRSLELLKLNAVSKTMVEDKKLALLNAQKKTADAKAVLEENHLGAPFDGVVGLFKVKDGSQVHPGDAVLQFYNPSKLRVRFDLPLDIAEQIHGKTNIFLNNTLYPLTYVQKMLDQETHMCPAYAQINCPTCIIGSSVDVEVILTEHHDAMVIPFEAVFLKNGHPCVYLEKNGKAILVPVRLGIRDRDRIEIISGVQEGDSVVTEGQSLLYDGALIQSAEDSFPAINLQQ